jgi:hypothetical protein
MKQQTNFILNIKRLNDNFNKIMLSDSDLYDSDLDDYFTDDQITSMTDIEDIVYVAAHGSIGGQTVFYTEGGEYLKTMPPYDPDDEDNGGSDIAFYEIPEGWKVVYLTQPGFIVTDYDERVYWDKIKRRLIHHENIDEPHVRTQNWLDYALRTPVTLQYLDNEERLKHYDIPKIPPTVYNHGDLIPDLRINFRGEGFSPENGVYGIYETFNISDVGELKNTRDYAGRAEWFASELVPKLIQDKINKMSHIKNYTGTIVLCTCMAYKGFNVMMRSQRTANAYSDYVDSCRVLFFRIMRKRKQEKQEEDRDNARDIRAKILLPFKALHMQTKLNT